MKHQEQEGMTMNEFPEEIITKPDGEPLIVLYFQAPSGMMITPCPHGRVFVDGTTQFKVCAGSVGCQNCKFNDKTDKKKKVVLCTKGIGK